MTIKFIVERFWVSTTVRQICTRNGFYTCGSNTDYIKMLGKVDRHNRNPDDDLIFDIAADIYSHSDRSNGLELGTVLYILLNDVIVYLPFVGDEKNDVQQFETLS